MMRRSFAASVLMAVVGLGADGAERPSAAADGTALAPGADPATVRQTALRAQRDGLERCYGINAAGRNDCATAAHACAGHATQAADRQSFVLLPRGDCEKIAGSVGWSNG